MACWILNVNIFTQMFMYLTSLLKGTRVGNKILKFPCVQVIQLVLNEHALIEGLQLVLIEDLRAWPHAGLGE